MKKSFQELMDIVNHGSNVGGVIRKGISQLSVQKPTNELTESNRQMMQSHSHLTRTTMITQK